MQNKGFVKVFAVLLTLVCLFYLSFSFVTQHYNSKPLSMRWRSCERECLFRLTIYSEGMVRLYA